MILKNALILYALTLFLISPIDILGEKVPKYSNIEPGGIFRTNIQRKLEENNNNYIIVKYKAQTIYENGFQNQCRQGIKYIINGNSTVGPKESLTIEANTEIQIHFSEPSTSLENFFGGDNIDRNVENIISIDFSHFNSSLLTNTGNMLYYCNSLEEVNFTNFDTSKVEDMMHMFFCMQ